MCICEISLRRPEKGTVGFLELEVQLVLICPVWVLATKLKSSGTTASALNC